MESKTASGVVVTFTPCMDRKGVAIQFNHPQLGVVKSLVEGIDLDRAWQTHGGVAGVAITIWTAAKSQKACLPVPREDWDAVVAEYRAAAAAHEAEQQRLDAEAAAKCPSGHEMARYSGSSEDRYYLTALSDGVEGACWDGELVRTGRAFCFAPSAIFSRSRQRAASAEEAAVRSAAARKYRESAALRQAAATGQEVLIESFTEMADEEENSLTILRRFATPSGEIVAREVPTH